MFKNWFEFVQQLFRVTADVADLRSEVTTLQKEVRDLTIALHALKNHVDMRSNDSKHEHDKLILRVENALLKIENRLPSAKSGEGENK
jgi:regulator of replication initiation timing